MSSGRLLTPNAKPAQCTGHSRPVTHLSFSTMMLHGKHMFVASCKDNNAILRDGTTGDWIGTFLGHKGAIWQSRISGDAQITATGSADYSAKVWDNENGKSIFTLPHGHIVRSVALSAMSQNKLITGTQDKRLRLYDLNAVIGPSNPEHPNGVAIGPDSANQIGSTSSEGSQAQYVELGQGIHQGSIKSIVYDPHSDFNFATACDDRTIRWWDLRDYKCTAEFKVAGSIGSCELNIIDGLHNNTPGGGPRGVLSAAAGDTVYFFDGLKPGMLIKQIKLPHDVPTVSLNYEKNQFITGSNRDPWVHVYDFHMDPMEPEVEVLKGHHGTVWTTQFSPDGKVFATGGDDAMVKIWKYCDEPYGLWGGSIEQTTNGA